MAEKGKIVTIGQLRLQRQQRQSEQPVSNPPTPRENPTKGRGGYKAAVQQYLDALSSGEGAAQEEAAQAIYRFRGVRGASILESLQTRHKARKRAEIKSSLHIVRPEE